MDIAEKWFYNELSRHGVDVAEDIAKYIFSIDNVDDFNEFILGLVDGSDSINYSTLVSIFEQLQAMRSVKKSVSIMTEPSNKVDSVSRAPEIKASAAEGGVVISHAGRKSSKFVPLYSEQGKNKFVIQLPGRVQCECQASRHKLVNNCLRCGRVVCQQEGSGPCLFCGHLVCSPAEQEILSHQSKDGENLQKYLMKDADKFVPLCHGGDFSDVSFQKDLQTRGALMKAQQQKDCLMEFDRTSVSRTRVIDDECDYFSTNSDRWLSETERSALKTRETELRSSRFASRKDRKLTIDLAGNGDVPQDVRSMYDHCDNVMQTVHTPPTDQQSAGEYPVTGLVHPDVEQRAPQFVPSQRAGRTVSKQGQRVPRVGEGNKACRVSVIQDRELKEMSDDGVCLSMHQPWASLLVAGIKTHEGRSWYTAHRGRLWVASTARTPLADDVVEVEDHCRQQLLGPGMEFPKDYPVGSLLGCVNLDDCLSRVEYQKMFPDSNSPSPYVFICSYPQELLVKFGLKGRHKLYKLDAAIHRAAKQWLR